MSYNILVVDDEPDVEMLIKMKFRTKISNVDLAFKFAANGVQALEILDTRSNINLIFLN